MAAKSFYDSRYNSLVNTASHITGPDLLLLLIFMRNNQAWERSPKKTVIFGFPADLSVQLSALEISSLGRQNSSCQEQNSREDIIQRHNLLSPKLSGISHAFHTGGFLWKIQEMKLRKSNFILSFHLYPHIFYSLLLYLLTPLPLLFASSSSYYISLILILLLFYYQVTFFPRDKIYVHKIKMVCRISVSKQL
jgi:hypothetical protein